MFVFGISFLVINGGIVYFLTKCAQRVVKHCKSTPGAVQSVMEHVVMPVFHEDGRVADSGKSGPLAKKS
jgi:hypothetical protein